MKIRNRSVCDDVLRGRKHLAIFLVYFIVAVTGGPIIRQLVSPSSSSDVSDSASDSSGRELDHAEPAASHVEQAKVRREDGAGETRGGSDVRKTSRGQCRVLSLSEAADLLARSNTSTSDDTQRQSYLDDMRQRLTTRTVVLCKAVNDRTPSNATTNHPRVMMSQHQAGDHGGRAAEFNAGSRNVVGKTPKIPDTELMQFRSADDQSATRTIHRLRHRRHYQRHRKRSPFNRKYYGRRSRRTPGGCEGRRADDLDVESVTAIMKAFRCWDDDVARLTNQLRRRQVTSSPDSELRCRLLRRFDDCRDNVINREFRTGHGYAVSWPRQVIDVMDPDDYSGIYY